ncbi:MAG: hypothetical protein ABFD84_12905 [Candidatus Polarisedimenticolia bacterium]|nr:hypothetical protein [bacterium]
MRVRTTLLLLALCAGLAGAAEPRDEAPEWGPLPADLQNVLAAKAQGYARRALKFSCRETVRESAYENEVASREKSRDYDYLLITDPAAPEGFRALRTKPGTNPPSEANYAPSVPEPYLWFAIFDARVASTLKYEVGEWHTTPWRLAIPVSWVTSAPLGKRRRVAEWSGEAEIEFRTGNLIRVVARPVLQDERIYSELQRYMQAFRFLGFVAAPPPVGFEMTVDYEYEHDGFTYPTKVEIVKFEQTGAESRRTLSKETIEYANYKFFGSEVKDEIPPLTWRAPRPAPKPPADAPRDRAPAATPLPAPAAAPLPAPAGPLPRAAAGGDAPRSAPDKGEAR